MSAPVSCAAICANSRPGSTAYITLPTTTAPSPKVLKRRSPCDRRNSRTATKATAMAADPITAAKWTSPQRVRSAAAASATAPSSGSRPGIGGCHRKAASSSTGPAPVATAATLPGIGAATPAPDLAFWSILTDMTNLLIPVRVLTRRSLLGRWCGQ
jgi:hypothetical protein